MNIEKDTEQKVVSFALKKKTCVKFRELNDSDWKCKEDLSKLKSHIRNGFVTEKLIHEFDLLWKEKDLYLHDDAINMLNDFSHDPECDIGEDEEGRYGSYLTKQSESYWYENQCIYKDLGALLITVEENTKHIILHEYEGKFSATTSSCFKIKQLFEGLCVYVGKGEYRKNYENNTLNTFKTYPIEFAMIGCDDYTHDDAICGIPITIDPPERESDKETIPHCGSSGCDACLYSDGCGYYPPLRENEQLDTVLLEETEIRIKLIDLIEHLSEELNILEFFPEEIQGLICSFLPIHDCINHAYFRKTISQLPIEKLQKILSSFMEQCEPMKNLFLNSKAKYFFDDGSWSQEPGDLRYCTIYIKKYNNMYVK